MKGHAYEGRVEDRVHRLFCDGKEEAPPPPWTGRFGWGREGDPGSINTATRILGREIPVPAIFSYIYRFADEVVERLPHNRPWRLTSEQIRLWMAGKPWSDAEHGA